jgi:hypothetical protein
MKKALVEAEENDPTKASVESVLPGVHQQFTNLHHEIKRMRLGMDEFMDEFKEAAKGNVTGKCRCSSVLFWMHH